MRVCRVQAEAKKLRQQASTADSVKRLSEERVKDAVRQKEKAIEERAKLQEQVSELQRQSLTFAESSNEVLLLKTQLQHATDKSVSMELELQKVTANAEERVATAEQHARDARAERESMSAELAQMRRNYELMQFERDKLHDMRKRQEEDSAQTAKVCRLHYPPHSIKRMPHFFESRKAPACWKRYAGIDRSSLTGL